MDKYSGWRHDLHKLRNIVLSRLYMRQSDRADVVERFHRFYYDAKSFGETWGDTQWLGVNALKCPFDLWVYQEILTELKPDLIIETGTYDGGSAFYLASICDLLGHGEIVTVDIDDKAGRPKHDRISYVLGSSVDDGILAGLEERARGKQTVMVFLDSDHRAEHVANELSRYHRLVTPGSYLVVEDTNVNGHPVLPDLGPGPMEAVEQFLATNHDFVVDKAREKFFLTFNPNGYLRKLRPGETAP